MSSFIEEGYELKIFILILTSGILTVLSLPSLIIGSNKICKMRKLQQPKAVFWSQLISLFSSYLVMATIFLLTTFVTFIYPTFDSDHDEQYTLQPELGSSYVDMESDIDSKVPSIIPIGISIIEFLFICSKSAVNFLFLCRLYYSFKRTTFQYSMLQLLPLFLLIIVELIIYILFSEVLCIHLPDKYQFQYKELNKIFLTSYHCIDIVLRIIFILLFERGLYRLATSRSFTSNLRLFGFGGASIDQIELSCQPQLHLDDNASVETRLKHETNTENTKNEINDGHSNGCTYPAQNGDLFTAVPVPIPEGDEHESDHSENQLDLIVESFHSVDIDDDGDGDSSNKIADDNIKQQPTSLHPDIDDETENISTPTKLDYIKKIYNPRITVSAPKINSIVSSENLSSLTPPSECIQYRSSTISRRDTDSHRRSTTHINDLISMSQSHDKKTSFAAKYLNSSSFDNQTKTLVKIVTKFSVLVVWSTITSIFAAVFFISFVLKFNDNKVLQNINASYIALIICFVEMHVVYLQLNQMEKWYKCLCLCCHNGWRKCCVCKLRRRLVKKIGKQHKERTIRAAQRHNNEQKKPNYKE